MTKTENYVQNQLTMCFLSVEYLRKIPDKFVVLNSTIVPSFGMWYFRKNHDHWPKFHVYLLYSTSPSLLAP